MGPMSGILIMHAIEEHNPVLNLRNAKRLYNDFCSCCDKHESSVKFEFDAFYDDLKLVALHKNLTPPPELRL